MQNKMKADEIKNFVCISGIIRENFILNHYNYYTSIVEIMNKNGEKELIPVIWQNPDQEINIGTPVEIMGEIRRYGKLEKRCKQMVLVRQLEVLKEVQYDSIVYLVGNIYSKISIGLKTEIWIEIQRSYNVTDSIPCFTMNHELSKELKRFRHNEKIVIVGRISSRVYSNFKTNGSETQVVEVEILELL